jgi:plastocyanin
MVFLLISAIVVVSCGKSNSYSSGNNNTPPPPTNTVSIVNMSFSPANLTVKAGSTVTWTNNDNMDHTVTSDNGSFDSGHITMGSKYSKVFATTGSFPYHCTIHATMKGTITVTAY